MRQLDEWVQQITPGNCSCIVRGMHVAHVPFPEAASVL